MATYTGAGAIQSTDYKTVTWTGKTKSGQAVVITLNNAINLEDVALSMVEKDEVIPKLTFYATYDNTDETQDDDTAEPFSISYTAGSSDTAADTILLGVGIFSIGGTDVALCRGGGEFKTGRVYRKINADGDRGYVKDRIAMDEASPSLTMNALTWLGSLSDMIPGITTA